MRELFTECYSYARCGMARLSLLVSFPAGTPCGRVGLHPSHWRPAEPYLVVLPSFRLHGASLRTKSEKPTFSRLSVKWKIRR